MDIWNAVINGTLVNLTNLVNGPSDANQFDKKGYTPLHYAARRPNLEIVRFLVSKGMQLVYRT